MSSKRFDAPDWIARKRLLLAVTLGRQSVNSFGRRLSTTVTSTTQTCSPGHERSDWQPACAGTVRNDNHHCEDSC
jgi:hypothetical protein